MPHAMQSSLVIYNRISFRLAIRPFTRWGVVDPAVGVHVWTPGERRKGGGAALHWMDGGGGKTTDENIE